MKGMLKGKSAGMQFVILISLAMVSLFFGILIATTIMSVLTGVKTLELLELSKLDFTRSAVINYMRGMQFFQFIFLFMIPSLVCARLFSTNTKEYLGLKVPGNILYFGAGIAIMIVAIPMCGFLGELNRNIQFPPGIENWARSHEEDAAKQMEGLLSRHTITDLLLNLICVAGFAAVGEELLFRGLAQRLLIRMFKSPWAGIIIAAILFSAFHFQFYGFIPRLALGILLGLVYWYSGSLWTSILAHFVYDAFLIILLYIYPEKIHEEKALNFSNIALTATISFLLVALLVIWMKKRSATTYDKVYSGDGAKNHPFDFDGNTPV